MPQLRHSGITELSNKLQRSALQFPIFIKFNFQCTPPRCFGNWRADSYHVFSSRSTPVSMGHSECRRYRPEKCQRGRLRLSTRVNVRLFVFIYYYSPLIVITHLTPSRWDESPFGNRCGYTPPFCKRAGYIFLYQIITSCHP